MLKSSIGIFFYFILQNRFVWKLLSNQEKNFILKVNKSYNNSRDDYNINDYQSGYNFEKAKMLDFDDYRTYWGLIQDFFRDNNKVIKNICEIGPGSGYYTSKIIQTYNINYYLGIELNHNFIKYLKKNLDKTNIKKYDIIDNFNSILKNKFDLMFFISSLHHIPDREYIFSFLNRHINPGGYIFIIEPTHYFPRICRLFFKFIRLYRFKKYYEDAKNLSTHHFLTYKEVEILAKKFSFNIIDVKYFKFPFFFKKYFDKNSLVPLVLKKYFSDEFFLLLQRK